jgi:hypothetical protein
MAKSYICHEFTSPALVPRNAAVRGMDVILNAARHLSRDCTANKILGLARKDDDVAAT